MSEAQHVGQISRGETDDGWPFVPGVQCFECGRFVGRNGYIGIGTFEMSSEVAYVEGHCRRCMDRGAAEFPDA